MEGRPDDDDDEPEVGAVYATPLVERYASRAMARLFSPRERAATWRRLWVALAEAERDLGLPIEAGQVEALRARVDDADLARVAVLERELRHDVMAHIHHYGEQCPVARGIIHLGATSCYVTDNADLIAMREGLALLRGALLELLRRLGDFARGERATACLARTHLQPAQFTTVGKRAALWIQDLVIDYEELVRRHDELPFLGVKGTTGTQASFLALFDGDDAKVERLDRAVADRLGFARLLPISAQTYPRKLDHQVLAALAGLAASLSKLGHDLRLLQAFGELSEPFGKRQVGSSAMPYKRNPMRSERLCSIARHVIVEAQNAPLTAATQWLERTLDDSANRRLAIPGCFLGVDAMLRIGLDLASGLVVHREAIARALAEELPFIASEDVLMAAVRAGGDRQDLHERIRRHAHAAREIALASGRPPDLLERLAADPAFAAVGDAIAGSRDPARFTGRAAQQVDGYLRDVLDPILVRDASLLAAAPDVSGPEV